MSPLSLQLFKIKYHLKVIIDQMKNSFFLLVGRYFFVELIFSFFLWNGIFCLFCSFSISSPFARRCTHISVTLVTVIHTVNQAISLVKQHCHPLPVMGTYIVGGPWHEKNYNGGCLCDIFSLRLCKICPFLTTHEQFDTFSWSHLKLPGAFSYKCVIQWCLCCNCWGNACDTHLLHSMEKKIYSEWIKS